MDPGNSFPEFEMNSLSPSTTEESRLFSGSSFAIPLADSSSMTSNLGRDDDGQSRRMSQLSDSDGLLPKGKSADAQAGHIVPGYHDEEPKKIVIDDRTWVAFWYSIPHAIPFTITVIILYLNVRGVYWQDPGYPQQTSILQAFQYAAKAHEVMMTASITTIVVHRIQHDLNCSGGVSFGFLTAGFRLDNPSFIFTKAFFGG